MFNIRVQEPMGPAEFYCKNNNTLAGTIKFLPFQKFLLCQFPTNRNQCSCSRIYLNQKKELLPGNKYEIYRMVWAYCRSALAYVFQHGYLFFCSLITPEL